MRLDSGRQRRDHGSIRPTRGGRSKAGRSVPAPVLRVLVTAAAVLAGPRASAFAQTEEPITMPRLWDAEELATWATPVAGLGARPGLPSAEEYYAAPVDNLRTYPVYHPRFEPEGYRDWIQSQGPRPLIEPETLATREDWIQAGQRVFEELDTPVSRTADPEVLAYFDDADAIDAAGETLTRDHVILDYLWVVDQDGTLKVSASSCQGCHTRLMPDGTLLPGAPSNYDVADTRAGEIVLGLLRRSPRLSEGEQFYADHGVPWREGDPHLRFKGMTDEQMLEFWSQETGDRWHATFARFNGSPLHTTRMADLNGIKDRRYLDTTGTHKNRGPEDLARYCILVEYAEQGTFGPHEMLPPEHRRIRLRPPDEAMYAMALYLYSLEPPASPFPFDDAARRGQEIFDAEGCSECHAPPAYTNNQLVPVPGFHPDPEDPATQELHVSKRRVGTDPGLALDTRKGTGYYRIPSLRGLWYRGLYEHSGSVKTLEDWFDPHRLEADYVPTGWRGPGVASRAVPGHEFGLHLSDEEKRDLIAFLKTL